MAGFGNVSLCTRKQLKIAIHKCISHSLILPINIKIWVDVKSYFFSSSQSDVVGGSGSYLLYIFIYAYISKEQNISIAKVKRLNLIFNLRWIIMYILSVLAIRRQI